LATVCAVNSPLVPYRKKTTVGPKPGLASADRVALLAVTPPAASLTTDGRFGTVVNVWSGPYAMPDGLSATTRKWEAWPAERRAGGGCGVWSEPTGPVSGFSLP